ncbi:hypothetical protein TSTA_108760 [Talaromyces stipitatus ATCC 10500]|uniref:Uncharacterized protein n=1 Tax=Talaromyces stipitatus (strain ATCC 10500 / CBS 375.48 / QM 6759 / NRRL 1006) TaxID=441959 RepID=B8MUM2_TALSN|nr:uncharacterized protein TSTA_108760 [Talaromyces stipitatus ATCC 10500]XP_002488447.1 uncharacterized protein TSTA_108760 [Talaromyces stipitatus ATCC 10500]XP_002488448.1 uncharacterized protein TSTA_108760 [Talaromyces stipitatus ATCC 10500]EED11690.1 hypothetical protein TSTA_108760 [Talaromyces stipitatus ATCC 10500]EED11691.1 hypothetical protein TSTA_108760 [Talaromyces stipitatus ATCC 10500]EED11692.1 hypothetical protein TSTA_108760 [Talaromyces stipitatus ATCC 10500]
MSVVDVVSPRVIEQGQKAWSTVKEQCEKINKPATGQSIGHCTPTHDCKLAMDYAIEDAAMNDTVAKSTQRLLALLIYFPKGAVIGDSPTLVIPIHIEGTAKIGQINIDTNHYYEVRSRTILEVPEESKVSAIVLSW